MDRVAIDDSLSADVTATESIYAIYSSPLEARLSILANCEVEITGLQCWLRVISSPGELSVQIDSSLS